MTSDAPTSLSDGPVAQLVSALAASGFPRMPAAVLVAIMVSEEGALTAEQLAERLGASPAAISGAVRYLGVVGMVHRHRMPGDRRFLYELPEHAWYLASITKGDLMGSLGRLASAAARELGPNGRRRVQEMADFFAFLEQRMPGLIAEWNELRER